MATRKRAAAPSVIDRANLLFQGEEPPTRAFLKRFAAHLDGDREFNRNERTRIADALYYLVDILEIDAEEKPTRKRGRPFAISTWQTALVVKALVVRDKLPLKTALWCSVPDPTAKDLERIKRTYHKLPKNAEAIGPDTAMYSEACARLKQSRKGNKER